MSIFGDIVKDADAFFAALWSYVKSNIGQDVEQIVTDAVVAAGLINAPGDVKKSFAFSNIVAAVGKDLVVDSIAMFNFAIEAAVQQQKANEQAQLAAEAAAKIAETATETPA